MARIAETSPRWELRVFFRDQNQDLMNEFLNQGLYMSIPVLAFFDPEFREIGRWIERSKAQSEYNTNLRQELEKAGLSPEEVRREYRTRAGATFRERFWRETVREIQEVFQNPYQG